MTVRSTFALDPDTAQSLERLAARWGVSKSEALRRSVAIASRDEAVDPAAEALEALNALQKRLGLEETVATEWTRAIRAERLASKR